jgi:hypothetical protein
MAALTQTAEGDMFLEFPPFNISDGQYYLRINLESTVNYKYVTQVPDTTNAPPEDESYSSLYIGEKKNRS